MNVRDIESVLKPLAKVGLSGPLLDMYFKQSEKLNKLNEIDESIQSYTLSNDDVKGEILIPFTHSQGLTDHLLAFLGHTFRSRGYRPLFVSCRGILPLCFRKQKHPDNESACVGCQYRSDRVLNAYGFEQIQISRYADNHEAIQLPDSPTELNSMSYGDVDVANYATATARRHLRKYNIDLDKPNDREIFERYLRSAIYFVDFTQSIIEHRDIVATVRNHPAYIYGGTVLKASLEHGLPAISYGGGYFREDAISFGNLKNSKGFEMFSEYDTLIERVQKPLSSEERDTVDYYMQGRRDGSTIRELNQYTQSAQNGLELETSSTIACMFTNLLWDGSLSGSSITFEDPFEWVERTIEFVSELDDLQLILKPHPAEAHRETEIQMADWVESEVDIPENVILLDANTDINPYELIQEIDLSIVLNSTVGMEAAYEGVPVITTGDTHYKNLGFTYDPKTADDYFDFLSRADELSISEEEKQRARRYAYFLLVERHISIDELDSVASIHKVDHDTIAESGVLDNVVEQILADERSIRISR